MYTTCSELVVFVCWTGKLMNNLLSYCGLVDTRISASEKDLPVMAAHIFATQYIPTTTWQLPNQSLPDDSLTSAIVGLFLIKVEISDKQDNEN